MNDAGHDRSEQTLTETAYSQAAQGWAANAELVYQPLADALVARAPHDLGGRLVLDACAGTGCGGRALEAAGARVVATDLSEGMLRHLQTQRPPAAVSDVCNLAVATHGLDDAILPFVLNHLPQPELALAEVSRTVRPGGAVMASVFSNASSSPARDAIDKVALASGFEPPDWYVSLSDKYAGSIGTVDTLAECGRASGLLEVAVDEAEVDTGITEPAVLVDYRLSMAHYVVWIEGLSPDARADLWSRATAAVVPLMRRYRPIALFLTAST